MADEIDRAQANDELFRGQALAEHSRRVGARHASPALLITHCAVCGDDIPEARRLAAPGCIKCIGCQTEYEQMHGR